MDPPTHCFAALKTFTIGGLSFFYNIFLCNLHGFLYLMVAHLTMRKQGVNQAFRVRLRNWIDLR